MREHKRGIIYIVCREALKVAKLSKTPCDIAIVIWRCNIGNNDFYAPKSLLGSKAPWVVMKKYLLPNFPIQLRTGGEAMLCNCPTLCFKEQLKQFSLSKRDSCPTFPSFL